MADDIDIEEHDVLDNPAIKSMFPDITVLKKEISQYFEDEPEIKQESVLVETYSQNLVKTTVQISKISDLPESQDNIKQNTNSLIINRDFSRYTESFSKNHNKKCEKFNSNKIILGSKPSNPVEKDCYEDLRKPYKAKVLLQDLHMYLYKSKRYCKYCLTLFPTKFALDSHKKSVHLHKNKNESNTNVRSKIILGTNPSKTNHKCHICNKFFSSSSNLTRHNRNIHSGDINLDLRIKNQEQTKLRLRKKHNISPNSNLNLDMRIINQEQIKSRLRNKHDISKESKNIESLASHGCFHCQKSFPDQKSLIEHLYNVLDPEKIECHECTEKFTNKEKLSQHILAKHKNQLQDSSNSLKKIECKVNIENIKIANYTKTIHKECKIIMEADKGQSKNTSLKNLQNLKSNNNIYQCPICSYCFNSMKTYSRHMNNKHKIKQNSKINKVVFNSQCKYCPSKSINIMAYNSHLIKYHRNKVEKKLLKKSKVDNNQQNDVHVQRLNKKIPNITEHSESNKKSLEEHSFALRSILFKCNKCDIHFLSSNVARKHLDHMEMLINWKCSICQRIFKKIDEVLHLKQHSLCDMFTVYDLCETALSKLLYNCPKCTIHYTEESYLRHYSICGSETPNSIYCKYCDLLIDKTVMDTHVYHHKHKNNKSTDFTIIESDVIFNIKEENKVDKSRASNLKRKIKNVSNTLNDITLRKRLFEQIFNMSYCQTCKCFLTDIALSRKAHVKSRCAHIAKHVCGLCGLVLTNKAMGTHRKLHQKTKNLKLQDYKFYDLNGKRICPPIPEYPCCSICGIHFLTKVAVKGHICSKEEYLTCHICQMKLAETVFKLHMSFHNYSINKAKNPMLQPSISESSEPISDSNISKIKKQNPNNTLNTDKIENLDCIRFKILYSCKSCSATLDTYDKVIEHCQRHYIEKENNFNLIKCTKCCFKFDRICYKNHEQLHLHKISFRVLSFDVIYFISENNTWIKHLFESVPGDEVQKILAESIYQFERRIKMEIIQKGPPHLTLYKCNKCNYFIDPINVYKHAENPCFKIRKYPCSICGVPYISSASRIGHEKIHKLYNIGLKSYNIVTFNRNEDKTFNNKIFCSVNCYVLYQCRNCDGVVDKSQCKKHECNRNNLRKCTYCGLLLYKEEYGSHNEKHRDLDAFNVENMKVILFGEKNEKDDLVNKTLMSSFNGMLYDYTLYKCVKCEICVKNEQCTLKHVCYFDAHRSKCPQCNLYFCKRALKPHLKLHESDSVFERDNLKIITFDSSTSSQSDETSKNISNIDLYVANTEKNTHNITETVVTEPIVDSVEKVVKIFKCVCGLHFLEEIRSRNHSNNCNSRIRTKQNCSKCGLLFTPSELFAHLLAHHGDKSHVYKIDVVEINRKDEIVIYKCSKCNLHFIESDKASDHNKYCKGTENAGEECGNCNLIFHSSSFAYNHFEDCRNDYKVNVINENVSDNYNKVTEKITDGMTNILLEANLVRDSYYNISQENLSKIDVTKYNNTIYKCNECSIHYLTKDTIKKHIGVGKHNLTSTQDVCNICGLNFTLQSLAKHMYVHHEKLKLTLSDLNIIDSICD